MKNFKCASEFLNVYLDPDNSLTSLRSQFLNDYLSQLKECGSDVDMTDDLDIDSVLETLLDLALVANAYPNSRVGELIPIYYLQKMRDQKEA